MRDGFRLKRSSDPELFGSADSRAMRLAPECLFSGTPNDDRVPGRPSTAHLRHAPESAGLAGDGPRAGALEAGAGARQRVHQLRGRGAPGGRVRAVAEGDVEASEIPWPLRDGPQRLTHRLAGCWGGCLGGLSRDD